MPRVAKAGAGDHLGAQVCGRLDAEVPGGAAAGADLERDLRHRLPVGKRLSDGNAGHHRAHALVGVGAK